ncbi:MAG: hypothetical protein WCF92_01530 [bacterium]
MVKKSKREKSMGFLKTLGMPEDTRYFIATSVKAAHTFGDKEGGYTLEIISEEKVLQELDPIVGPKQLAMAKELFQNTRDSVVCF